ncbi:SubName: Full=Uncharacterized protein {ECO:0000313/EMBL:CCA76433.1} [Serendipita indica DSM 11827]|nr:SubName: Full=Uncharacterized protein {ECO:0000313/EMBL:CCA76433.1} [Serendipita indica DSM 11827]
MSTRRKVSSIKKQQQPSEVEAMVPRYHPYQAPNSHGPLYNLAEYARYHAIAAHAYAQAMPVTSAGQPLGHPSYSFPITTSTHMFSQPVPIHLPLVPTQGTSATGVTSVAHYATQSTARSMTNETQGRVETSREEVLRAEERWARLEAERTRLYETFSLKRYAIVSDPDGHANIIRGTRDEGSRDPANTLPEISSARVGPFYTRLPPPNCSGTSTQVHHCPLCNMPITDRTSWEVHYKRHYEDLETRGVRCARCGVHIIGRAAAIKHRETQCDSARPALYNRNQNVSNAPKRA